MIRVRPAILDDADALARVMIDANEQAFRGLVPERCLRAITPQESARNWRRTIEAGGLAGRDCLLVAEHDAAQGIIGFALARVDSADSADSVDSGDGVGDGAGGELRVISVSPPFQRQGAGRRLVGAVATHLASLGVTSMVVRVLSVNPNRGFYERLGARFLREEPYDWNGVVLPESVYEWPDLSLLVAAASDARLSP